MSGDPEQEYFSDGIADDIITELSRSRSLFVIARNSSFTYKGSAIDIKQVGARAWRALRAGRQRARSGERVRVIAQLIDAETGNHIWAERYDRDLEDIFAVQDEITLAVVTAIGPAVADAEQRRALRKPPESLGAWEAYQRGLWHFGQRTVADARAGETTLSARHRNRCQYSARHTWAWPGLTSTTRRRFGTRSREDAAGIVRGLGAKGHRHRSRGCGRTGHSRQRGTGFRQLR